jgi:hypothetical protein
MVPRTLIILVPSLLAACEATLTETRRRVKGPVAEVGLIEPGAGQVRYPLKGPGWLVARRRKHAYALMEKHCGGPTFFKVLSEKDAELAETRYIEEDLEADEFLQRGHYKVEKYREVEFECVKP